MPIDATTAIISMQSKSQPLPQMIGCPVLHTLKATHASIHRKQEYTIAKHFSLTTKCQHHDQSKTPPSNNMASSGQKHTVYLTPQEAERMRTTFQGRQKKCQELKGEPRINGDRKDNLSQVTGASLMSDLASAPDPFSLEPTSKKSKSDEAMIAFAPGEPYPPCQVSVQDLQPMKLSELRMETHHRGRVLAVKRIGPVVTLVASSWTVVEEEGTDETERLEISLHKSSHGDDILESGSRFEIKEPYFTLGEQGPTIRIDHPSDLVCKDVLEEKGDPGTAALRFKEKGNAALKEKDLRLAHANYTQGLKLLTSDGAAKEDLTYDLFRNRAHVNLALNRFDEAKTDGLAAQTNLEDQKYRELDSKAYFRAGSAAYNLGDFQTAKEYYGKQQQLMPSDKNAIAHQRNAELRLKEQATGEYNFKKLRAGLSLARPGVDASTFTAKVKIGESAGRGRGLFAARDIKKDEIVLAEKAFCTVWGHQEEALTTMVFDNRDDRIKVIPAGLCKSVVQKLSDNPSQVEKVMDLYGDYAGLGKELIITDGKPVIDIFQVYDIIARNAFGPGAIRGTEEEASNASTGLWVIAAYVNHSCIPNAKKEYIGDLMILRATQPISTGQEIFHSYDESPSYEARTASLQNTWGFTCTCALCTAEKGDSAATLKKRAELENEANALIQREDPVRAKRLVVLNARRLARSLGSTYDEERYKDVPKRGLQGLQAWLEKVTIR